jgi:tripartite-type tricarboxylate transporter receptor subunit TctC
MRRRSVLAAALAAPGLARAARALRILVAYPPGGVSDRVARQLAQSLSQRLDKPVLVENHPGAGGSLALGALARALPDGNTLAFSAITPLALAPHLGHAAPAVLPVAGVMHTPVLLLGTPALGVHDFAAMLHAVRTRAEGARWATSGIATLGHLVQEQVKRQFRLDVVHVP